jgi:hypothetical protein
MKILVGQEARKVCKNIVIDERPFRGSIIGALVMLQAGFA